MENEIGYNIYSAMQTGEPYKTYIKTILGKIYVMVLNPFSDSPEGLILHGNPRGKDKKGCIVSIWDEKGDAFFKTMNERHLGMGWLVEYNPKGKAPVSPIKEEKSLVEMSDDELLEKVLNLRYVSFTSTINSIKEPVVLFRLLEVAKQEGKSPKIIRDLKSKLAEVQSKEYGTEEL